MIPNLKTKVQDFLKHQAGSRSGEFKFSYSGDLLPATLDASCFAAKLYQMLGLNFENREQWIAYIKSFENVHGEFYDPLIVAQGRLGNMLSALRRGYFGNFFGQETRRAGTRQAWATLAILGGKPNQPYASLPSNAVEVKKFLDKLNWHQNPWNAGSHAGQLITFYARQMSWFGTDRKAELACAIEHLARIQSVADGSWHANPALPNNVRVNAAMKVITGLVAVAGEGNTPQFQYPEKLIDLCLQGKPDSESCSTVDRIYVLYYASRLTSHRAAEVQVFAQAKMKQYEDNFRKEGGFSFYPVKAQDRYLGARISKGLDEPDMQGTVLGVWGVVLLAHLLDLPEKKELFLPTI